MERNAGGERESTDDGGNGLNEGERERDTLCSEREKERESGKEDTVMYTATMDCVVYFCVGFFAGDTTVG